MDAKASNWPVVRLPLIDQSRLCKYIHPRKDAFFVSVLSETSRPIGARFELIRDTAVAREKWIERLPENQNC